MTLKGSRARPCQVLLNTLVSTGVCGFHKTAAHRQPQSVMPRAIAAKGLAKDHADKLSAPPADDVNVRVNGCMALRSLQGRDEGVGHVGFVCAHAGRFAY